MSLAAKQESARIESSSARARFNTFGRLHYKRQLLILLIPYLLGLLVLVVLPALLSIPIAFTEYNALSPAEWIGLQNFQEMFSDDLFWNAVRISAFFIIVAVPLRVMGAVLLASLLYKRSRANSAARSIVYLPTIIPDVAYALLWLYIFNPLYGPLGWVLQIFGIYGGAWLLFPNIAPYALVLMLLWPIGEGFVLMLAALQDIPGELHEAAATDGATGWQRFRLITMPLLAPAILLLFLRDTILSFQTTFVPVLVTFEGGKPYYSTQLLPVYIWQNASEYQRFGYAASMTWVMYGITAVIVLAQFLVFRRWRNALYD